MIRTIEKSYSNGYNTKFEHDDTATLSAMQANCPIFFANKMGFRETYTPYRGFLIVRATEKLGAKSPERKTSLFIYAKIEDKYQLWHVDSVASIAAAKKRVDTILLTNSLV